MTLSTRLIVILFLSGQIAFYGQNKTIDSLKLALKNAKHDTAKVQILQSIGEEIYGQQPDSAYSFYERANAIIDKKIKQYSNNSIEYKCLRLQRAYCLNNIGFVHENKGENQLTLELSKISTRLVNLDSKIDDCVELLKDLDKYYEQRDVATKKRIVSSIFPSGLIFENKKVRTLQMNKVVSLVCSKDKASEGFKKRKHTEFGVLSHGVDPERFELSSK
jgi:hypothetical protein